MGQSPLGWILTILIVLTQEFLQARFWEPVFFDLPATESRGVERHDWFRGLSDVPSNRQQFPTLYVPYALMPIAARRGNFGAKK